MTTQNRDWSLIRTDRLEQLAAHLETGVLGVDVWCFETFYERIGCDTLGCAIGECVRLWPDDWRLMNIYGGIYPHRAGFDGISDSAEDWFGIKYMEYEHLFVPDCQCPERYGGDELTVKATREAVADNIRTFIDWVHRHREVRG